VRRYRVPKASNVHRRPTRSERSSVVLDAVDVVDVNCNTSSRSSVGCYRRGVGKTTASIAERLVHYYCGLRKLILRRITTPAGTPTTQLRDVEKHRDRYELLRLGGKRIDVIIIDVYAAAGRLLDGLSSYLVGLLHNLTQRQRVQIRPRDLSLLRSQPELSESLVRAYLPERSSCYQTYDLHQVDRLVVPRDQSIILICPTRHSTHRLDREKWDNRTETYPSSLGLPDYLSSYHHSPASESPGFTALDKYILYLLACYR